MTDTTEAPLAPAITTAIVEAAAEVTALTQNMAAAASADAEMAELNAKYQKRASAVTQELAERFGDATAELALRLHAVEQVRASLNGMAVLALAVTQEHQESDAEAGITGERYVGTLRLDQLRDELIAGVGAEVLAALREAGADLMDVERDFEEEAAAVHAKHQMQANAAPAEQAESPTAQLEQMGT